jgi:uncharacterized repeat protein (TIGR01451 family)
LYKPQHFPNAAGDAQPKGIALVKNLHDYKRWIAIPVALIPLLSATLCWTSHSSRAAVEIPIRKGELSPARTATNVQPAMASRTTEAYGKLSMSFEANRGQTDPRVAFISRQSRSTLFLTPTEAVFAMRSPRERASDPVNARPARVPATAIKMKLVGANPAAEISGRKRLPGNSNYFRGSDPSKWQSSVATYDGVFCRDVYPGVNLVYYGNEQNLEYDFQVAPGSNPAAIRIAFEGVRKISINADGDLVLSKSACEIRMHKPTVYQETDGTRRSVDGRYVLRGRRQVAIDVGKYDKTRPLVIDPVLSYSTFLGGTNSDYSRGIAVDSAGNAYVTGQTYSFNYPVTIDGYDTTYANYADVCVTKLNADGSAIVYSTYLGGNSDDIGYGIAIDSSGSAYVTGLTSSADYPTTPGAYQTGLRGSYSTDTFVTKLNSDGTAVTFSTYLGGSSGDQANGIAVDSSGNTYTVGYSYSSDFPITPGAFQTAITAGSSQEAFLAKLNNTGTALVYSTFLGGSGADQATAVKVDLDGYAYVSGLTTSANFDITPGAYQATYAGASDYYYSYGDAFATKFNPTGTGLSYSTYIGGAGDDAAFGIDLASSGEVYLTGSSSSGNFPTTSGVVRVGNGGVAKSTNGADSWFAASSGLTNSTELSLAIDPSNPNIVFVGSSGGGVFKSTNGGANWAVTNSGLTDLTIKALAIDQTNTSLMYLGTNSRGVFRSTDSGATWRAINTGQNGMSVNTIKIDPAISSTIYAGTDSGIFKTTNGGASWVAANTGLNQGPNVSALVIDPGATSTLYAAVAYYYGSLFRSTDGGAHWSATGLNDASIRALAIDDSAPSTIYAGTANGIQKSTDSGANWSGVNTGLADRTVNVLAISPADSAIIYSGTANGIFKSTNGGTTWGIGNSGLAGAVVNTIAIDPATPLTLYCGSAAGSTDAFVAKLNATGTALDYSTYLGGSGADQGSSVAIDASGNAYLTGTTASQNFPTTRGVFQVFGGYSNDAFVTKLNPTGATLVYSTYLGGTDYDQGFGLFVDSSGSAYVTGYTQSQNFPTTPGAFQSVRTGYSTDGFITKLEVVPSLAADLAVTMTTSAGPFTAASYVVYNITLTNNGPDVASSILVSDELPSSLIYNSCYGSPNYCTHAGNSVTFAINSLAVGASASMQISAYVSCSIPSTVMIDNVITVDSSSIDSNLADNSATASIDATNTVTTLSPTNQSFPLGGGSGSVSVNRGSNCSWTSMSNVSWVTITYSSNCCNGIVNYTVAANPGIARTGTMTIAGQTFTVNQETGCMFSIDHDSNSFSSTGGTDSVEVTTSDASCNWIATSNAGFINITSGGSGTGNGTVNYSVDSNPAGVPRSGTLTIAGKTFTVTQLGVICTFSLSASSHDFDAAGGSGTVDVITPSGCVWTAVSNDSFITITSGGGGTGNGTVAYSVAANTNRIPRMGTMTIANNSFTIRQSSSIATPGLYNPTAASFFLRNSNTGGTADISFAYGPAGIGFIPLVGDWNGDGVDTIGLYNPASGAFFLRNSNSAGVADISFAFGPAGAGWLPLVGDWNGDGADTIGLYNPTASTFFLKNSNSTGVADVSFAYGPSGAGWLPIVGDWDGNATDTIGLYDPAGGTFFLRNTNSTGVADLSFAFGPGGAGWKPVVGDWNGDGVDSIGLYNPSASAFFLRNTNSTGMADASYAFGPAGAGWTPLVGDWDGL